MLLKEYIDQSLVRHKRLPDTVLVTPKAVAVLTSKGESIPDSIDGVKIKCIDAGCVSWSEKPVGATILLMVVDNSVFTSLQLVDVD